MIEQKTMYNVKNRSSSIVVYRIPETNLRREFQPGEVKRLTFDEMEKLTYQPGGRELLENFLQIMEEEVTSNLSVKRDIEYDMDETQIRELLAHGSLDAFLDALDFAPIGVIDLIKSIAVALPLTDLNKRKALRDKTGFDVDKALVHIEEERQAEAAPVETVAQTRRVQPAEAPSDQPTRRTKTSYKVVVKEPVTQE